MVNVLSPILTVCGGCAGLTIAMLAEHNELFISQVVNVQSNLYLFECMHQQRVIISPIFVKLETFYLTRKAANVVELF